MSRHHAAQRGVTLLEMMVVVALMGLLAAVAFPSVAATLSGLRLTAATRDVASLLNGGLNRAERRQQPVEFTISRAARSLAVESLEPGFRREVILPLGLTIGAVYPEVPDEDPSELRRFLIQPGGTLPRLGVLLVSERGQKRIVRVDPLTGVPEVEVANDAPGR